MRHGDGQQQLLAGQLLPGQELWWMPCRSQYTRPDIPGRPGIPRRPCIPRRPVIPAIITQALVDVLQVSTHYNGNFDEDTNGQDVYMIGITSPFFDLGHPQ